MPQPAVTQAMARVAQQRPELLAEHRTSAPQLIAARFNDNQPTSAAATDSQANPSTAPAFETVLVIRTTQQVGPNSWVWSVAVWRVNLVNSDREGAQKPPLAKKT
jgi:hypothetical protein